MSFTAYNDTIIVSRTDDELAILSLFESILNSENDSQFQFMNLYKELPITASATICEIRGGNVDFVTSQTQLAAMHECGDVLIESSYLNTAVIGKPKDYDIKRNTVTISNFSFAEVHVNKRNSVRVRLKIPINLNILADGNKLSGVIRDISIGGACVSTFAGAALGNASDIVLIIKLLHATTHELVETKIPSRLVRLEQKGVQCHCILVFNHTAETEKVLSTFIYQRQLEIIKELKDKVI